MNTSELYQQRAADSSMDDFEFFEYVTSIVNQLEQIERKGITSKALGQIRITIECPTLLGEDNKYQREFRWLKNLCLRFISDGSVRINEADIPQGIEHCSSAGEVLSTVNEMIDFLKSIRLNGSEGSVEYVQGLEEE